MSFPTRMTIVCVAEEDLFIHSPTPLTRSLRKELERIGRPRWIIAPNRIHYWWIPDWRDSYPDAVVYLAPRVSEQAAGRITFEGHPLDRASGYPWDEELASLPISGSYMTEVEFFHYRTRTLILTDLIENFELRKLNSFVTRWLTWLGKVQDPDGQNAARHATDLLATAIPLARLRRNDDRVESGTGDRRPRTVV
ncbi:DUF4336 domain-containing protein [Pseudorhizobium halotolerans]